MAEVMARRMADLELSVGDVVQRMTELGRQVSARTVDNWLEGRTAPRGRTLHVLLDVLQIHGPERAEAVSG